MVKVYTYFIVALTSQHKLISDYIRAKDFATAMDYFIETYDLQGGQILEYKFCLHREHITNKEDKK